MSQFNKFHFSGQKEDETIILVLHRHWFDILSQFLLIFVMLFVFMGSFVILPMEFPQIQETVGRSLFLFLENLFLLFTWVFAFIIWIDYYFDVWIVTDQRIINIQQKGLFARVVSELELEKIQDITTEVHGIIHTMLNFGDLFVQTAAEKERFIFHNIPDPYTVKNTVMDLQKKKEIIEEKEFGELISEKMHSS